MKWYNKKNILFIQFVILLIIGSYVKCEESDKHYEAKGKCVFLTKDSGVYSFYGYTASEGKIKYSSIDTENENLIKGERNDPTDSTEGFFVNLCNDTLSYCKDKNNPSDENVYRFYDSQIVYRNQSNYCFRYTGYYHKGNNQGNLQFFENKDKKEKYFLFKPAPGEFCKDNQNFEMTIKFIHDKNVEKGTVNVEINQNLYPQSNIVVDKCKQQLVVRADIENPNEYLLLQRILNNYYVASGLLMILVGLYLCFLAKNEKATKFVVSIIFSMIITFVISVGLIGAYIKYLEIVFFLVGLIVGSFIGYVLLDYDKIFSLVLATTSGFIFGLFSFDIIFAHGNYYISTILLLDSCLVFIILSIIIVLLLPKYQILFNSIIGGYTLVRGISVLLYKVLRYRELQIIIYLINRYEFQYADYFYKTKWNKYWVYCIFMGLFMIGSMIYYYIRVILTKLYKDAQDDLLDEENEKDEEK